MKVGALLSVGAILFAHGVHADPPDIRTERPLLHLADNLDESQNLGWCIDTVGRGFGETLHAHSCKPSRDGQRDLHEDVRFDFDPETGRIVSLVFDGLCMEVLNGSSGATFGLTACSESEMQVFSLDPESGRIALQSDPDSCVTVGATSRPAGRFMARDLILEPCGTADPLLSRWTVTR